MEKMQYRIEAKKVAPQKAAIYITGEIGWDVVAENFRREVEALAAQGVSDAHVYLFGPGGSCFEADEMVNILQKFPGRLTGEGGALVASAYTYISTFFDEFTLPANGQFMIHKPKGGTCGTAADLLSYHKLLSDMEAKYYTRYKAKACDARLLDEKWNAGDWWMTAAEAAAAGFATLVKTAPARIDTTTAQMIAACGYPHDANLLITNKQQENMNLKAMAASLGLPEGATEQDIAACIEAQGKQVRTLEAFKRDAEEREKKERAAGIEACLDAALADHRITADTADDWRETLSENYERGSKMLRALVPVEALSKQMKSPQGKAPAGGKTFEQWQEDDPEGLKALHDANPAAYDGLFADWLRRNGMK